LRLFQDGSQRVYNGESRRKADLPINLPIICWLQVVHIQQDHTAYSRRKQIDTSTPEQREPEDKEELYGFFYQRLAQNFSRDIP
jgi:hypothetical protein